MSDLIFERLRVLVLESVGSIAGGIGHRSDLIPIEQTEDGWFCLVANGHVAHVDEYGANDESIRSNERATALIGNLAVRFPLATWFVPRAAVAIPCPACVGTGQVIGVPAHLKVVCQCGGLGWLPVSE